jgi:hypothetical protein
MIYFTEITKSTSLCCRKPVHIAWQIDGKRVKTDPFCSKCGKFPPISKLAVKRALKLIENNWKEK